MRDKKLTYEDGFEIGMEYGRENTLVEVEKMLKRYYHESHGENVVFYIIKDLQKLKEEK